MPEGRFRYEPVENPFEDKPAIDVRIVDTMNFLHDHAACPPTTANSRKRPNCARGF